MTDFEERRKAGQLEADEIDFGQPTGAFAHPGARAGTGQEA